ncbi:MAG: class F sortase [Microbacteriaceae bacterium]|nr:class F sortase [Microbacteriaceae bacterium]
MTGQRRDGVPHRVRSGVVIAISLALVLAATATIAVAVGGNSGSAAGAPNGLPSRAAGNAGKFQDPSAENLSGPRSATTATRVQIPAIGVDSGLEQLALDPASGTLTPPVAWLSAGWYAGGTVPGDIGPAVIAGHVDSVTKPAVFARLGELVAGSSIVVTLSDGTAKEFVVERVTRAPKDAFPTQTVYGPTPTPQLRLITCDGIFNRVTGHYLDNLIVFASLAPR